MQFENIILPYNLERKKLVQENNLGDFKKNIFIAWTGVLEIEVNELDESLRCIACMHYDIDTQKHPTISYTIYYLFLEHHSCYDIPVPIYTSINCIGRCKETYGLTIRQNLPTNSYSVHISVTSKFPLGYSVNSFSAPTKCHFPLSMCILFLFSLHS